MGCASVSPLPDVEVRPGSLPLIISAPHGGSLRPGEIPRRSWGSRHNDVHTVAVTEAVAARLLDGTGEAPTVIINHLARATLDANRDITEAAQDDPRAEDAWHAYHEAIEGSLDEAVHAHGFALLVDLHGHRHVLQRVELGYRLQAADYSVPDARLDDDPTFLEASSISALVRLTGLPLSSLLRGPDSLGAALEQEGIPAVPGPADPDPGKTPYWNGGYTTARYGVEWRDHVAAIQVECPRDAREERDHRRALGESIGNALVAHLDDIEAARAAHLQ